jgi:hypothetical protein
MVAVKGHGIRHYDRKSDGNEEEEAFLDPPQKIPGSWHTQNYDLEFLVDNSSSSSSPSKYSKEAGVDYPPYLLSMGPKTTKTKNAVNLPKQQPPFPFGPLCPPTELCCGSLVKYYAIASGQAAGFLQLSPKASGYVNSWDHAPGMLCVEESGGGVLLLWKRKTKRMMMVTTTVHMHRSAKPRFYHNSRSITESNVFPGKRVEQSRSDSSNPSSKIDAWIGSHD